MLQSILRVETMGAVERLSSRTADVRLPTSSPRLCVGKIDATSWAARHQRSSSWPHRFELDGGPWEPTMASRPRLMRTIVRRSIRAIGGSHDAGCALV